MTSSNSRIIRHSLLCLISSSQMSQAKSSGGISLTSLVIYGNYKLSDPRLAASRIITNYTFSLTKVTTSRASPPDRLGCCRTPQPRSSHQTMIVYRPHNGGGETPATGSQMRPDEGSADHPGSGGRVS